jgi:hypothetical protein
MITSREILRFLRQNSIKSVLLPVLTPQDNYKTITLDSLSSKECMIVYLVGHGAFCDIYAHKKDAERAAVSLLNYELTKWNSSELRYRTLQLHLNHGTIEDALSCYNQVKSEGQLSIIIRGETVREKYEEKEHGF